MLYRQTVTQVVLSKFADIPNHNIFVFLIICTCQISLRRNGLTLDMGDSKNPFGVPSSQFKPFPDHIHCSLIVRRKTDDESLWLNFQTKCFGDISQEDRVKLLAVFLTHSMIYSSDSQSAAHRPAAASPGNLTEMFTVRSYS